MFDKFRTSTPANRTDNAVVVIGLGRFGGSLAVELMSRGTDVMGIDISESIVQSFNGKLTSVVRADATDEDVLRQLGVDEFERSVVGIGSDIQASILVTSRLLKFQCPEVWAKAITAPHAEILEQLGVHHVVNPERDMGLRTAPYSGPHFGFRAHRPGVRNGPLHRPCIRSATTHGPLGRPTALRGRHCRGLPTGWHVGAHRAGHHVVRRRSDPGHRADRSGRAVLQHGVSLRCVRCGTA